LILHENPINKNIIKNQNIDLIGFRKALTEGEKSCSITLNKLNQ
jgi:hypothetical protein